MGQKHLRWFSQTAIIPFFFSFLFFFFLFWGKREERVWIVWSLCLGLQDYLLPEKGSLSLIVCLDSCRDNSMSVKGHATIVQDERGVKVRWKTNNTSLCFGYAVSIEQRINTTLQWPLCVAFFKGLWKVLCFLQWPHTGKFPWKVLCRQNR